MQSTPTHRLGTKAIIVRDGQILLVEYQDQDGVHYNLPGGGVEEGEAVKDALIREILEETGARAEVGDLVLVSEYIPEDHGFRFGGIKKLTLFFRCALSAGEEPRAPDNPDQFQVGVRWFPTNEIPPNLYPLYHDLILQIIRDDKPVALFTRRT